MFALSMGAGMDMCFPDVCLTPTPVGPLPIPYPNMAMSAATMPMAFTVLTECTPTLNMMSKTCQPGRSARSRPRRCVPP